MLDLIGKVKALPSLPTLNPLDPSGQTTTSVANKVLGFLMLAAGTLAVVYLIYGGVLYITAGGDAEKATKGRTAVINAIIGIIIILLAYVIVSWVSKIVMKGSA